MAKSWTYYKANYYIYYDYVGTTDCTEECAFTHHHEGMKAWEMARCPTMTASRAAQTISLFFDCIVSSNIILTCYSRLHVAINRRKKQYWVAGGDVCSSESCFGSRLFAQLCQITTEPVRRQCLQQFFQSDILPGVKCVHKCGERKQEQ